MVNIQEKLDKGYVHCRIIIEIIGKPKEHVESTIKGYIDRIKNNFDVLSADFAEIKELKDQKLFATFVELEMLIHGLPSIVNFCFDYMPSSIEIIEPKTISLEGIELSRLMNDMQSNLHSLDNAIKQLKSENSFLKRNSANLIKNMLRLLLFKEGMNLEQLSKLMGVDKESLKNFIDLLVKKGELKQEGENYHLPK